MRFLVGGGLLGEYSNCGSGHGRASSGWPTDFINKHGMINVQTYLVSVYASTYLF